MNKKSVKIVMFLVIITVVIIILQLFISMNTVYIGNNTRVISIGSKIYKYNKNKKIILKKIKVYKDGRTVKGFLKSTKADNEIEYHLVSSSNKKIDMKTVIASGQMVKLSVVDRTKDINTINDTLLNELNDMLDTELKIENVSRYNKITYDIDNDSIDEQVLYVSYLKDNISVDRIFIYDDNLIDVVDYEFDYKDVMNLSQKAYDFVGLIDFNNDNKYEVVVSRVDGDSHPAYYDIYSYENGIVKEIK